MDVRARPQRRLNPKNWCFWSASWESDLETDSWLFRLLRVICDFGEDSCRVPCTARRSNQSILKEIHPVYLLGGLMLKLKLQYIGHLMWKTDSLEKTLMLRKIEGRRRRGQQRMRWLWHHWLNGYEFEQTQRNGKGQGGLVCCSPRGREDSYYKK